MPKRPRQHQLEAESRAMIRTTIPSRWVYRDLDQDYGIDSEIEIFDENDLASGAIFLVQLKATDEVSLNKALTLWFPISKGEYFASLDLPVLIVRYHAPSGRLFVRWFHNFDPYYGKRTAKGITFHLNEKDCWGESTADRLENEVQAYRELRSPRLNCPITFQVSIQQDTTHGIPTFKLNSNLRRAANQISHVISLDGDESSPYKIIIDEDRMEVQLGATHGFTMHTPKGYDETLAQKSLHFDIFIGIGLALDLHGHSIEGAEIIGPFVEHSRISQDIKIAFPIARCLSCANQMYKALEIAERFFVSDSAVDTAQVLVFTFIANHRRLSNSERNFGVHVLKRMADWAEQHGQDNRASMLHYNIANLLRSAGRLRESIREYRAAARLDETYLSRAYFWQELAGAMFDAQRYTLSVEFYRRALSMDSDRETKLLFADALMFNGQFRESEEIFDQELNAPPEPRDAEWSLKSHALAWLREQTKIDEHHRRKPDFGDEFEPSKISDEEVERICREALRSDALSALAWFSLGGVYHRRGETEPAANCFLLSSLIAPRDLESWGNVIGLAMNDGNMGLLAYALYAGYSRNGQDFLSHVAERSPEAKEELFEILSKGLGQIEVGERDLLLRYHTSEGVWEEMSHTCHQDVDV